MIDIQKTVKSTIESVTEPILDSRRQVVLKYVMDRFAMARKKPVPDLPERIEKMHKRISTMVEELQTGYEQAEIVVKVTGSAQTTLRLLERGTDWFEPMPDLSAEIIGIAFSSS